MPRHRLVWLPEAGDERSCALHAGLNSLDGLAVFVVTFGFPFTTHEPPELSRTSPCWPPGRSGAWAGIVDLDSTEDCG